MADAEPADEDLVALGDAVHSDLAARLVAFGDGHMLTRFVAMLEVLGPDGDRSVINLTSADMRAWEALGLLQWGLQLEQALIVRDGDA